MDPPPRTSRTLAAAAYLLAAGLIGVPLIETLLSVWPLHPDMISWRFGTAGMLSRGLLTSLLGLVMAVGTALLLGHRRTLRTLAVLSGVGSMLLVTAVVLLTLDAVQLKGSIRVQARTGYELAAAGAILKTLNACLVTALVAVGAWRMGRQRQAAAGVSATAASKLAFRPRNDARPRLKPSAAAAAPSPQPELATTSEIVP